MFLACTGAFPFEVQRNNENIDAAQSNPRSVGRDSATTRSRMQSWLSDGLGSTAVMEDEGLIFKEATPGLLTSDAKIAGPP